MNRNSISRDVCLEINANLHKNLIQSWKRYYIAVLELVNKKERIFKTLRKLGLRYTGVQRKSSNDRVFTDSF